MMKIKYTEEQVETMRQQNADFENECMSLGDLEQLLMDGCIGWQHMAEADVILFYEENVRPQKISNEWD